MDDVSPSNSDSSSDDQSSQHLRKKRHKGRRNYDQQKQSPEHSEASSDHSEASSDHSEASSDHSGASSDHSEASSEHLKAPSEHSKVILNNGVSSRLQRLSDDITVLTPESSSASQSSQQRRRAREKSQHHRRNSSQYKDDSDAVSLDGEGNSDSQSNGGSFSRKKIKVQSNTEELVKYGCKDVRVRLCDISSFCSGASSENQDISIVEESGDVRVLTPKRPSISYRANRRVVLSYVEEDDDGKYRTRRKAGRKNYREIESDEDESEEAADDSDWEEEPKPKHKRNYLNESEDDSEEELFKSEKEDDDDRDRNSKKKIKKKTNEKNRVKGTPLSEYEKMIQKNRDDKMAFLQSLAMNEVKDEFASSVRELKPKREKKEKKPKEVYRGPPRKSDRATKVNINFSEDALCDKAHQASALQTSNKELPPQLSFEKAFVAKEEKSNYLDFVSDFFDHMQFNSNKEIEKYRTYFEQMKLHESGSVQLSKKVLTHLEIHPTRDKIVVAAALEAGSIGFWVENSASTHIFRPHNYAISHLKFNPDDPMQLFSSAQDGSVRCGDLCKEVFSEIFNAGNTSCKYFDFLSPTTFIAALGNGEVSIVDTRSWNKYRGKRHKSHEFGIRTVSVHPTDKQYFITTDKNGPVHLWDLRNLRQTPEKRDWLKVVYSKPKITYKHVGSAFYSPFGNSILLTTNKSVGILDADLKLKEIKDCPNIAGSVPVRATWLPNSEDYFAMGNMTLPRGVGIFNNVVNKIFDFTDTIVSSTICSYVFHPQLPVLTCCGKSTGRLYVFKKDL